MSRLLPGAPGQTPGLFTGPRPGRRRRAGPPARPRPSDALTRSSRGRAGPLIGRGGGGGDGGRARGSRDGSGRARAKEGRSRAGSGPPALGALAAQIIRASEREAESGARGRRRRRRGLIACRPTCLGPPPPAPATRSRAADPAGAETTAFWLLRALPPLAPPPPPLARPRARALSTAPPLPPPGPAPRRPLPRPAAAARPSGWRDPDVGGPELRRGRGRGCGDVTARRCSLAGCCRAAGAWGWSLGSPGVLGGSQAPDLRAGALRSPPDPVVVTPPSYTCLPTPIFWRSRG